MGGYKRPCETLWGLIQPIGCRQREHVVVKENGKARRGIHTNENRKSYCFVLNLVAPMFLFCAGGAVEQNVLVRIQNGRNSLRVACKPKTR